MAQQLTKPITTLMTGRRYNFKGQPDHLVYMGARRYAGDNRPWYQFAKVATPHICWCEVLAHDLTRLEETKESS